MANDTVITVIGNLTADPELRFTQSGVAVASFTIASTPRTFDRQSNEWKDGEALFMRCALTFARDIAPSAGMAALIRAAYDPVLPVAATDAAHALRLAARMGNA